MLKIPERIIYYRFHKLFLENKIIDTNNLFFKLAIQVNSQLFNLTIKYLKLFKIVCICQTCLLSFQKAFQIVDNTILLKKF